MPDSPRPPQPEFYGYVYFDDPQWWHRFAVTPECARAIQQFRQAIIALMTEFGEDICSYEAAIHQLWQTSERVVNLMQWHAKRDIAVMVALAQLFEECVDRITPVSSCTEFIRNNLKIKATSIRSLLSTMHDVHCCNT
mgnify:CR=1 FL=1